MSKQRPLLEMIHELQSDIKRVTHDNDRQTEYIKQLQGIIDQQHKVLDYWQQVAQTLTAENQRCGCNNVHQYIINERRFPPVPAPPCDPLYPIITCNS